MRFCVLGSGSKGNCTLIESGKTALLIDAGFSGVEIRRRLEKIGRTPEMITAILVTHEHNDHISGVGVFSRRCGVPVYANPATHLAAEGRIGEVSRRREFATGESFTVNGLQIHPFVVSHDTAEPVGFVVSDGRNTVGYCTDTGRTTRLIAHHLRRCQALILESNHDPRMLRDGPYSLELQQRVRSNLGHLANEDAADFLAGLIHDELRSVVLAHLSQVNNLPKLALAATREKLVAQAAHCDIILATQESPSRVIDLAGSGW